MNFLEKLKLNLFEQVSFMGIAVVLFVFYFFIGVKVINILVVPGLITFITYKLVKGKLLKKYSAIKTESEDNSDEIEKMSSEEAKNISYKMGFFIYIFYVEFYFLGLPKIKFLPFPFNNFIIFYFFFILLITYLKLKKIKEYEIYIYTYLFILFCIPIINKILEIIR